MRYKYSHFIQQNIAPPGAKRIVTDSSNKQVCTIPLGGLTPPSGEKLYSFGSLSDIHIYPIAAVAWHPEAKFDSALAFFEAEGCAFVVVVGDLTQTGFTLDDTTTGLDTRQFAKLQELCEKHGIPAYCICGNHESITNKAAYAARNQRELLIQYTGHDLYYTIERGDDLFVFVGQPDWDEVMDDEELQWLYETLEENRNRRCFVYIHSYIEGDSGDPLDVRKNSVFDNWGATKTGVFMSMLRHYKNTVLFHGHSHAVYESQVLDKAANYTERNGFRSVHVPSLARPLIVQSDGSQYNDDNAAQACIMDVYAECIVLRGMDMIGRKPIPIGTYRIDTTLVEIPAGTFVDPTGMINTGMSDVE